MSIGNGSHVETGGIDQHVRVVVQSAEKEIKELLRQKAELMKRIGTIKQTLAGLANMFGDSALSDELLTLLERKVTRQSGFTSACRMVLMDAEQPMGARQICEELQRRFPEILENHKEPMASVTTVLSRLVTYAEARSFINENGRKVWEWVADPAPETGAVAPVEFLETGQRPQISE